MHLFSCAICYVNITQNLIFLTYVSAYYDSTDPVLLLYILYLFLAYSLHLLFCIILYWYIFVWASACILTSSFAYDTSSAGGMFIPEITSATTCYAACVALPECVGYDLSGPSYNLCWLYFDPVSFRQKYNQPGVLETSFTKCPEQGKPAFTIKYIIIFQIILLGRC